MIKLIVLLLSLSCFVSCDEDALVRLGGRSQRIDAGVVEVWSGDDWRRLCTDQSWDKQASDVVCRQLGFSGSVSFRLSDVTSSESVGLVTRCQGTESSLSQCQRVTDQCRSELSIACVSESRSACSSPGSVAMLGSCYHVITERRSFGEAQQQCAVSGGDLVEINSQTENMLLGRLVDTAGAGQYWTGGVIPLQPFQDSRMMFWHGSQLSLTYDNDIIIDNTRPSGISLISSPDKKTPVWKPQDFNTRLPFICKYAQSDIGCLADDDPRGVNYVGDAAHDADGHQCLVWRDASGGSESWSHNHCRNPAGDEESPWCYVRDGSEVTYNYCNIPPCSVRRADTRVDCSRQSDTYLDIINSQASQCYKEEYQCRSGDCISSDHVCDGVNDCADGDDEAGCRRMSSLFSREAGFKLEGVTDEDDSESVAASLEECAKMCVYKKPDKTSGCCSSFSHRPGSDGKGDRCILSTVFSNSVFDGLVEKKAWNYYKLNITDDARCKDERDQATQLIDALRLRNKRRGVSGNMVEVRLTAGAWGGVCDAGFGYSEADVVCRQLGYEHGAKKVFKAGNSDGKGGRPVLGSVKCSGSETSIKDCDLSEEVRCDPRDQVSVECATMTCDQEEFQCPSSGECVPLSSLCDGSYDCRDTSDEDRDHCSTTDTLTQVRLTPVNTGAAAGHTGLLEVLHNGVWGSVCKEYFSQTEADLFCSMMQLGGAVEWRSAGGSRRQSPVELKMKRQGSWPIWINFREQSPCDGSETRIEECHEKQLWSHDDHCDHSEDIILTCKDNEQQSKRATSEPQIKQLSRNCGVWRKTTEVRSNVARIAGGAKVKHGDLPWQAAIRLRGPNNRTYHHCGAVIISPYHVLTTAHCIWDYRDTLDIYYVRVGDNIIEVEDDEEQDLGIEKVDFHENFGVGPYLNNDIAVVHIDRSRHRTGIKFGDKVVPVCLPQAGADYSDNVMVTVSGWGKLGYDSTEARSGSNFVSQLNSATLPVISSDTCSQPEVYGEDKLSSGMFCAGKLEGGVDTCQGDSGGPAISYQIIPELGETRATLMGLTSWGYGCGRQNKPGVYTKVSKYVGWIINKVRQ